jgi:transcriptional regulator with XRE-family HTH domain
MPRAHYSFDPIRLGTYLRMLRVQRSLTVGAVASLAGVSERTIRRLEQAADHSPTLCILGDICTALGEDPVNVLRNARRVDQK